MNEIFVSSMDLLKEKQSNGYKQIQEELIGMRATLKQTMDKGLAPADMEVAQAMAKSVNAAETAMGKLYTKMCG